MLKLRLRRGYSPRRIRPLAERLSVVHHGESVLGRICSRYWELNQRSEDRGQRSGSSKHGAQENAGEAWSREHGAWSVSQRSGNDHAHPPCRGGCGATHLHVVSAWQARGESHAENCRGAFWKLEA